MSVRISKRILSRYFHILFSRYNRIQYYPHISGSDTYQIELRVTDLIPYALSCGVLLLWSALSCGV